MKCEVDRLNFNVYGKMSVLVIRENELWKAYKKGNEGKRGALNIVIPPDLRSDELLNYLEEVYHEWATPEFPQVIQE